MALNPNHTFEDLGEIKCSIVEKNCSKDRVDFLKKLLEHNKFTVIVVNSPTPKAAKPALKPVTAATDGEVIIAETPAPPTPPETFTVGVTDLTFSPTNAVFNRELITLVGKVVTSNYWKQLEAAPKEEEWYWKK